MRIKLLLIFLFILSIPILQAEQDISIIVEFNTSKGSSVVRNLGLDVDQKYNSVFSGVATEATQSEIEKLEKNPNIKAVYEDIMFSITLDESVPETKANQLWDLGYAGEGIKVAVIDTGVNCENPYINCAGGYDFKNNDAYPTDSHGHGTHVSGIIASNHTTYRGVAPEALIVPYKVCNTGTDCSLTAILAALERAAEDKVDVISMSLGGSGSADDIISEVISNLTNQNIIVVVSAGNNGPGINTIGSPGSAPDAITVGAYQINGSIADFSSRGPIAYSSNLLAGIKPDLIAPGVNIISTWPSNQFMSASGTSMSCPHVSGAAALLKQAHPDWTAKQIKSALTLSAIDTNHDLLAQGAGKMDIAAANNVSLLVDSANIFLNYINGKNSTYYLNPIGISDQNYSINSSLKGFNISFFENEFELLKGETKNLTLHVNAINATQGLHYGFINFNNLHALLSFILDSIAPQIEDPTELIGTDKKISAKISDENAISKVEFYLNSSEGFVLQNSTCSGTECYFYYTESSEEVEYYIAALDIAGNLANLGNITSPIFAKVDIISPIISNISISAISQSSATVSWITDEASSSEFSGGITYLNLNKVTSHSVALSGLTSSTKYDFAIKSCDSARNCATSSTQSFTTSSGEGGGGGGGGNDDPEEESQVESVLPPIPITSPEPIRTEEPQTLPVEQSAPIITGRSVFINREEVIKSFFLMILELLGVLFS